MGSAMEVDVGLGDPWDESSEYCMYILAGYGVSERALPSSVCSTVIRSVGERQDLALEPIVDRPSGSPDVQKARRVTSCNLSLGSISHHRKGCSN